MNAVEGLYLDRKRSKGGVFRSVDDLEQVIAATSPNYITATQNRIVRVIGQPTLGSFLPVRPVAWFYIKLRSPRGRQAEGWGVRVVR
jgi:hypothetical protein